MTSSRQFHLQRKEAKWQFRRLLLVEATKRLESQPELWAVTLRNLRSLQESDSQVAQKCAKRWVRFASGDRQEVVATIHRYFDQDTPVGERREKLHDLTNGHPFSGILAEHEIKRLRDKANRLGRAPGKEHIRAKAI